MCELAERDPAGCTDDEWKRLPCFADSLRREVVRYTDRAWEAHVAGATEVNKDTYDKMNRYARKSI